MKHLLTLAAILLTTIGYGQNDFELDTNQACTGTTITMTNLTDLTPYDTTGIRYYWDFGDGIADTSYHTMHSYATPGIYLIALASDSEGVALDTTWTTVTIFGGSITNNSLTICSTDSAFLAGAYQNIDSIYYDTLLSIQQCDSIVITTLTIEEAGFAGANATSNYCSFDFPFDINDIMDSTATPDGTWNDVDSSGAILFGFFSPTLAGEGSFEMIYEVPAGAYCPADTTSYTINILASPFAGFDGTGATCYDSPTANLWLELTPLVTSLDGSWTDLDGSGGMMFGMVTPAITGEGTFDYQYVVVSPEGCGSDTSVITLNVDTPIQAGEDGTLTICDNANQANLFESLNGSPDRGGFWDDIDQTFAINDSMLNPANAGPGVYDFMYRANNGCGEDSATVVVTIDDCTTGINELDQAKLSHFPTPSNGTVNLSGVAQEVIVLSTDGRMVYRGIKTNRLQLHHLPSGSYFIQITDLSGTHTERLILN